MMMSGQSVMDRVQAARHSVMGSQIGKKVCKATTEEILAPKRKHLEDLLQYTHDQNVNVTDIIDYILSRTHTMNWVVVYKSLITLHHLMSYGHERVIQNMASRTMELNLANYYDRKDMTGSQMSPFIQRYSKYLSTKAGSYRSVAFDFCHAKRGRDEGKLRNMETPELLMALPALSDQLDALLAFNARSSELQNGIIVACFMLLFKDCIRLFACYNEGIINLLEKFFDMNKKQCEEALKIYKTFLKQMENVSAFLKTAEEYGIDKGDIPDLTSAPNSLLEALESHYQSLEGEKKSSRKDKPVLPKQLSVNAEAFAANLGKPQSNNPFFFDEGDGAGSPEEHTKGISEAEKQRALEEEQAELSKYGSATNPFAAAAPEKPPPPATSNATFDPFDDLLGGGGGGGASVTPANDPFSSGGSQGAPGGGFGGSGGAGLFNAQPPAPTSNPFLAQSGGFQPTYPPTQPQPNQWMNDLGSVEAQPAVGTFNPFGGSAEPSLDVSGGGYPPVAAAATNAAFGGPPQPGFPSQPMPIGPPAAATGSGAINFDAAFGASAQPTQPNSGGMGAAIFGDMLQPTRVAAAGTSPLSPGPMAPSSSPMMQPQRPAGPAAQPALGANLDDALANLSLSLAPNNALKTPLHWQ